MTNIGVFASGRGSNFAAVLDRIASGDLANVRFSVVISNNSSSGALALARRRGIPACHISRRTHPDPSALQTALLEALQSHAVRLVLLAGYMKLLPPNIIRSFPNRIINIHPALLPRHGGEGMYGRRVHEAVLRSGDPESGATVHFVTDLYDGGPVIARRRVPVRPGDTPDDLAARVLGAEHELYWRAVDHLINGAPLD